MGFDDAFILRTAFECVHKKRVNFHWPSFTIFFAAELFFALQFFEIPGVNPFDAFKRGLVIL